MGLERARHHMLGISFCTRTHDSLAFTGSSIYSGVCRWSGINGRHAIRLYHNYLQRTSETVREREREWNHYRRMLFMHASMVVVRLFHRYSNYYQFGEMKWPRRIYCRLLYAAGYVVDVKYAWEIHSLKWLRLVNKLFVDFVQNTGVEFVV